MKQHLENIRKIIEAHLTDCGKHEVVVDIPRPNHKEILVSVYVNTDVNSDIRDYIYDIIYNIETVYMVYHGLQDYVILENIIPI
jgi:DNA-dependent RNA polymerase auxiliary subunit epsilon